jgi:hypothetical protein
MNNLTICSSDNIVSTCLSDNIINNTIYKGNNILDTYKQEFEEDSNNDIKYIAPSHFPSAVSGAILTATFFIFSINAAPKTTNWSNCLDEVNSIEWETSSLLNTKSESTQENFFDVKTRKNYRDRYNRISKSKWFINAYKDMSIGDVILTEE